MSSFGSTKEQPLRAPRHYHRPVMLAAICAVVMVAAACSSSGGSSPHGATSQQAGGGHSTTSANTNKSAFTLTPPTSVKTAGDLKICADIVYPPYTFMQNNQPAGIDVDVVSTLAAAMGVKVEWVQTAFPGIVAALQGGKCDAIVNGINGTADHAKVIAQVPYLRDTQGFVVKKGNPLHIQTLDDLSGKSVATQLGSSTATYLESLNKKFQTEGKAPMSIVTLPQDTAAFSALLSNRVDAYFQDGPVLGYYARKYSDVEVLPLVENPQTVVIGIRQDDTALISAAKDGITQMYAHGIMQDIAKKWGDPAANYLSAEQLKTFSWGE